MSQETVERLQRNSRFLINVGEDLEEINSLLASRINLHTRAEPAGWPNLMVESGGRRHALHRQHNPFSEWSDILQHGERLDLVACVGTGFGYQVPSLLAAASGVGHVVLVEPWFEALVAFMTELELADVLSPNVHLVYARTPERLFPYLKHFLRRYDETVFKLLPLESVVRLLPEYCRSVHALMSNEWKRHLVYIRSMEEQHADITANVLENLGDLPSHSILSEGCAGGQRALVVASGPSLDFNLPLLPALAERAHVVCIGSALTPLLDAGVEPDMVVVTDPQPVNVMHFPRECYGCALAYDPVVPPQIVRKFRGELIACNVEHELVKLIAQKVPLTTLECWGTVTSAALALCGLAGFDQIALLGSDMSFPSGDQTHSAGYLMGSGMSEDKIIEATDVTGRQVATTKLYREYARYVGEQAAKLARRERRIIFCSEGGLLEGCESITLRRWHSELARSAARKGSIRWGRKMGLTAENVNILCRLIERQTESAFVALDRVGPGRANVNTLMGMIAAGACEGAVLPQAQALEKAVASADQGSIDKRRADLRSAMKKYSDGLVRSIRRAMRAEGGH